ncbi:MAG TPA: sulfurtransferase [Bacteroidetes bacterium]|nr:sulfurtransferase [Bacteroidota bacterium]
MTTIDVFISVFAVLSIALFLRRYFLNKNVVHVTATEARRRMSTGKAVFVDVRTSEERSRSLIQGSIHIPLQRLSDAGTLLASYRDREIIVYCASGSRSVPAAAKLTTMGFRTFNLDGGIGAWRRSST